jgi:hypothetical protein
MSTNISNKSERRNKEKEELIQRLLQIQKEEEEEKEEQVENAVAQAFPIQNDFFIRQFNNDNNIIIDNKVKRKRLKIDNNDSETETNNNISSNINTNISNTFENEKNESRITQADKTFLDLKQQLLTQDFLKKHADNDNLYIFPNLYEPKDKKTFILLNLPEDKDSFQDIITNTYKVALSNQHGIMNFNNFKLYYTNTLQSIPQIIDEVTVFYRIWIYSCQNATKVWCYMGRSHTRS